LSYRVFAVMEVGQSIWYLASRCICDEYLQLNSRILLQRASWW